MQSESESFTEEVAKQLLASGSPQEGFVHLRECGCLDLTVEALVLQYQFKSLFTRYELIEAKRRLEELNYYNKK